MSLSSEIVEAAQELGAALRATSSMKAYLEADAEFHSDPEAVRMAEEIRLRYQELSVKEQAGQVLAPGEINQYHNLLDQQRRSRLFQKRDASLKEVQFLLAQTADSISSVLSVNYNRLVER